MNAVEIRSATNDDVPPDGDLPPDRSPELSAEPAHDDSSGGETPGQELSRPNSLPTRSVATRQATHTRLKIAVGIAAYLALLGLAFYVGTSRQRDADRQLYTQYHPAQSRTFTANGGGGTTDPLVAAALAVGEPLGSGGSSGQAPAQQGTQATGGGNQGTAAPAQAGVAGQLTSIAQNSLTIRPGQGAAQSVAVAASTRFYAAATAPRSALAVGERVAITAAGGTAESVTVAPAGGLEVTIGPASQAGAARGGLVGTITALQPGSITVQTQPGATIRRTLSGATAVYRVTQATRTQLHAGQAVAVEEVAVNGHAVASDVVASGIRGTTVRPAVAG